MTLFRNIRSLRKKFLLGFISLSLLALALVIWVVSDKVYRSMEERIQEHLVSTVREQGDSLKEELEMKWRWVNSKADTSFIVQGVGGYGELKGHLAPFLRQLTPPGRGREQASMILLDSSGRVLAHTRAEDLPSFDFKKAKWFSEVIEYGNPRTALIESSGKPVIIFAAPVFVGEKTAGALVAEFGMDFVRDILGSEKAFQASLLSPGGRVIKGELPAGEAAWLAAVSVAPDAPRVVVHNGFLYGIGVLNAPLEAGSEYLLILSAPLADIIRPVAALRWYIFGIGLLMAVLLAVLVYWLSGELLEPLSGLKSAMELIMEKADISMRVRVSTADEIGALSTAFNLMLDSLDEKKLQLEASREQLALLAGITSTSPLPIMLVGGDLKIQVWNEAAEKLFGWKREEILGRSPFDTVVPAAGQAEIIRLRGKKDQREAVRYETSRQSKDGEQIPVESISSGLYGLDGGFMGNIVVYRDLREIRKLQESILQSEKMSAVGQLAAGVAHEINNPLGIILGFAQGLAGRTKENDAMVLPLRSIEREAVRCKNLVQNLLVFSRTSKSEQREETPLAETIEGAMPLISARTKTRNIELVMDVFPGPLNVLANRNQLQQVVINLANNAIDAMPGAGKLTIRVLPSAKKGYAELRVEDTGEGIPRAVRERIFEPFFTTKETGKGTGLGLSLVYEIVQKHNGTVEVESEEGHGSRFTVRLPLHPEKAPPPGEKP